MKNIKPFKSDVLSKLFMVKNTLEYLISNAQLRCEARDHRTSFEPRKH